MTGEQMKQLRGFYHSLKNHQKILTNLDKDTPNLRGPSGEIIVEEINQRLGGQVL